MSNHSCPQTVPIRVGGFVEAKNSHVCQAFLPASVFTHPISYIRLSGSKNNIREMGQFSEERHPVPILPLISSTESTYFML